MKLISRPFGLALIVIGAIWLISLVFSFSGYQYAMWVKHSQQLPAGELVPRVNAVSSMREMALNLNRRSQQQIIPVVLIVIGGIIVTTASRRRDPS